MTEKDGAGQFPVQSGGVPHLDIFRHIHSAPLLMEQQRIACRISQVGLFPRISGAALLGTAIISSYEGASEEYSIVQ